MSIVRFADLTAVPWKNGLGITREIAASPAGATMDDFLWRVSLADVDTASPFSVFPGIDRTIVLLEGDGFVMTLDGGSEHALTTPCMPFGFPGEARVDVKLAGGATRDFNLMLRRDRTSGGVRVVEAHGIVRLPDDAVLAHVARGAADSDDGKLSAGDTWLGTGVLTPAPSCTLLVVSVGDRRPP